MKNGGNYKFMKWDGLILYGTDWTVKMFLTGLTG